MSDYYHQSAVAVTTSSSPVEMVPAGDPHRLYADKRFRLIVVRALGADGAVTLGDPALGLGAFTIPAGEELKVPYCGVVYGSTAGGTLEVLYLG